jgi:hypothetical protein
VVLAFLLGLGLGRLTPQAKELPEPATTPLRELPPGILEALGRFTFRNLETGRVLEEYRYLGHAARSLEEGGVIESFVVGFEDRAGLPEADYDYLDLLVELKWIRGSGRVTVRVVQLGLDRIEVLLDGERLGIVRPTIEIQVRVGG